MKQQRAVKVELYPTDEQRILIHKTFGCVRAVWNDMFGDEQEFYAATDKHFIPTPAKYKKKRPYLSEVDSLALSDCSHPLRSGVLREGRYAPFSNTSRPWLVVSPGRELFAPCGEKDPPTHACLLRNLPKKVVCAKTSTFQLRKMVTHLHAADAQPLAELAPRRMRLSCRLSVRALGESYDSLPLPKQRPAC